MFSQGEQETRATGEWAVHGVKAPFVGRKSELGELAETLTAVMAERSPRAVTLVGNAGIGKTRLLAEFLDGVQEREPRVRIYRGAFREGGATHGAFRRILRARFGIMEGAPAEQTQEKFRKDVAALLGDRRVTEFLHFLGAFLDLSFPPSPFIEAIEDDPTQVREVSRAVLKRFFEVDANKAPIVLAFEDLHFAADEALDLLHFLITQIAGAPVLIVCVARPDLFARRSHFTDDPSGRHTRLELAPLAAEDVEALATSLLGRAAPPANDPQALDDVIGSAVDMAGGNPFLLEQMVRIFLQNGTLEDQADGSWRIHPDRLASAQLPLTVDDAVQARIAALSPRERKLLESAATVGSVFWLGALVAMGRLDRRAPEIWGGSDELRPHFEDVLDSLVGRDYVLEMPDSTIAQDREFAFKHNLERERIQKLSSAAAVRRNHRLLAHWLEYRLLDRGEEQLEMLASHYERGGDARKAAHYYIGSGDRARARYANDKAVELYDQGLALLGEDDATTRMEALHNQGDVLALAGRNDEALEAFRKMLALAWQLDLKAKGGAAHNRIGRVFRDTGRLDEAMRFLGTGHALFDAAGDRRGVGSSLDDIGKVHWLRGSYEPAMAYLKEALRIRQELGDERSIGLSLNNLGLVYQDSGRFAEAIDALRQALSLRRQIGDLPGVVATLNNLGTVYQDQGEHEKAVELWKEGLEVARDIGDRLRQAYLLTNLGEAHYRLKRPAEAVRILRQAEEMGNQLDDRLVQGEVARGLGKAFMYLGDLPKARDHMRRALELFEGLRSKVHLGVVLRTLGEVTAAGGWGDEELAQARDHFTRAIRVFEEIGNEVELGRTCKAYGEFLAARGEGAAAALLLDRARTISDKLKKSTPSPAGEIVGPPGPPGGAG